MNKTKSEHKTQREKTHQSNIQFTQEGYTKPFMRYHSDEARYLYEKYVVDELKEVLSYPHLRPWRYPRKENPLDTMIIHPDFPRWQYQYWLTDKVLMSKRMILGFTGLKSSYDHVFVCDHCDQKINEMDLDGSSICNDCGNSYCFAYPCFFAYLKHECPGKEETI